MILINCPDFPGREYGVKSNKQDAENYFRKFIAYGSHALQSIRPEYKINS